MQITNIPACLLIPNIAIVPHDSPSGQSSQLYPLYGMMHIGLSLFTA
jgi:hypothetical protein